jgi:hypothetical protein
MQRPMTTPTNPSKPLRHKTISLGYDTTAKLLAHQKPDYFQAVTLYQGKFSVVLTLPMIDKLVEFLNSVPRKPQDQRTGSGAVKDTVKG